MDIKEIKKLKLELQQDITLSLSKLTAKFSEITGLCVEHISVDMTTSQTLDGKLMSYITDVECSIRVFD